jgi:D-glycero-D-manno-heptose 1,7-bisphosphate phosphatase
VEASTIFIDRDGVINRKPSDGAYVTRWEDFIFLPGSLRALHLLANAGLRTIVITNQRGVARGLMSSQALRSIHDRMLAYCELHAASVRAVYVCEHETGTCECRKPAAGLLLQAKQDIPEVDFAQSALIGDSASDLEAGFRLGCTLALVGDGPRRDAELRALNERGITVQLIAPSLLVAVQKLLGDTTPAEEI